MALEKYNAKRDFASSSEPKGKKGRAGKQLSFVVQRHAASHLHYDFRLEMDGVLKSWAVPKGPSLYPKDKRLAMMTEDHPKAYASFEGTIAKGNYGAGEVEIWDKGSYEALERNTEISEDKYLQAQLLEGSIKFRMNGGKLKGEFALVKMNADGENAWLLIKHKDEYATTKPYNAEDYIKPESKVSHALAAKNKGKASSTTALSTKRTKLKTLDSSGGANPQEKMAQPIAPMLAGTRAKAFDDHGWIFEIKWDGYRAIADNTGREVKLYSRNGLSFSKSFPSIFQALKQLKHPMVLDGELVVMDADGKPSFGAIQNYVANSGATIVYYVFDLLRLNGEDTTTLTLLQRKELLQDALPPSDLILYSDHIIGSGIQFFEAAKANDLEGIMAKKGNSEYLIGRRSDNWLKIKNKRKDDAVIIGYTAPKSGASPFAALLLATVQTDNSLAFAGHVGTGFTVQDSKELYELLQPLIIAYCPIPKVPKTNAEATWVLPRYIVHIQFTQVTKDGLFRHPVYEGIRQDMAYEAAPTHKAAKLEDPPAQKSVAKKVVAKKAGQKRDIADIAKEIEPTLKLSNLEKVIFPQKAITKARLIAYYHSIAKFILPHLHGRPLSLLRFPNGIDHAGFYHKNAGEKAPTFVQTELLYSQSSNRDIAYVLCQNEATLLYLANLGCIGMHPWSSELPQLDSPTWMAIDLDPSEQNSFEQVIDVALATKQVMDEAGVPCYCKTSGSSGLHIYTPIAGAYTYEQCTIFAQLIALKVQELLPDTTTLTRALKDRPKTAIYLDYLQNKRGQTLASAYSARANEAATVSTPLAWREVKRGLLPSDFTLDNVPKRLEQKGDLFAPVLGKGIDLQKCLERMQH